jgi:mRNA interferase RelE/StbE
MRKWKIEFTFEADEDLDKLDKRIRKRVIEKVIWLRDNFNQIIPLPLSGKWQGFFKLRIGDWRVIYEIEAVKNQITIHRIDHRDKIYKII